MTTYYIKQDYTHRDSITYFDDTKNTDEWQNEVYAHALDIYKKNKLTSVVDIGTGSGFKLIKYFNDAETLGIDVPETLDWLKKTYPSKKWSSKFESVLGYDLLISSDVIEHIENPDNLLDLIEQFDPKYIVLSTPDRGLLPEQSQCGPPINPTHVREWSFEEFEEYIGNTFDILEHFISNKTQATQVIVAKPRL